MRYSHVRDYEVVVYDVFRAGVITAFVFHDYIKQSEALYNALDTSSYSNQVSGNWQGCVSWSHHGSLSLLLAIIE